MDFWVFGYGSLIWRPGFPYEIAVPARIYGYHRALCVYSFVHRGTPARPGLVMGLDRGGSCTGVAYRVPSSDHDGVLAYLREREQSTMVYKERRLPVHLSEATGAGAKSVEALVYCVDRSHEQYAGGLDLQAQLDIVRDAIGKSGRNPHYVIQTQRALRDLGVRDARLEWLSQKLSDQDAVLT